MLNLNHFSRQSGLIDPKKLNMPIAVIGAGGIGSWTCLALLKMGCQDVTVYDFDTVEEGNLGSQIYNEADIGKPKTQALIDKLFLLSETELKVKNEKWTVSTSLRGFDIVIAAVDSIEARDDLFKSDMRLHVPHFIDGRMAKNEINLYYAHMRSAESCKFYEDTLFPPEDAIEVPCSERAVVYNTFVVAGLICAIVAQIANNEKPKQETIVDLRNFMMN